MTRTPQLWRTRRRGSQVWLYFWYTPGAEIWPARISHAIVGNRRVTETADEPSRLIRAGKVSISHVDVDYYIEGRL